MTRQELIAKATEDPEFRERLKADPRATFAHEFATTIPDDLEITVLEETPKHAYIVLPVPPSELSPEELDAVSGAGWAYSLLMPTACSC
jgi:hypothetical protein